MVQDCLELVNNLLRNNPANQLMFRSAPPCMRCSLFLSLQSDHGLFMQDREGAGG